MKKKSESNPNSFESMYLKTEFLHEETSMSTKASKKYEAVGEGNKKGGIFYNTHSYPTKVPVDNIVKKIEAHTKVGDTVMDSFCGSGMTGLASKLTGRNVYLSDLGSLALHLATNHVVHCSPSKLQNTSTEIIRELQDKSPYYFKIGGKEVEMNYLVYADTFACTSCRAKISTWDAAKTTKSFSVPKEIQCEKCGDLVSRPSQKGSVKKAELLNYIDPKSGKLSSEDVGRKSINESRTDLSRSVKDPFSIGKTSFDSNREMYIRSALHLQGVTCLRDFYSDRNWIALNDLYEAISRVADNRIRSALMFAFTNTAWHASKMRRYNAKGGHRPLTGTLYFPQLYSEGNVYRIFENKIETLVRFYSELEKYATGSFAELARSSATEINHVDDLSINYIYTDPPFGSNIFYADCNFIAESWLAAATDIKDEAVVNKSLRTSAGGKSLNDYQNLMHKSFSEMNRVLKKNGKMSLVFNSSSGDVWEALMDSLSDAGLTLSDASLLDKVQLSFKGNKAKNGKENVATTDLVLDLEKKSKQSKKDLSSRKPVTDTVLAKAFKQFSRSEQRDDSFKTSNFYSFLLKYCHLKGYSFEEISMNKVTHFIKSQDLL